MRRSEVWPNVWNGARGITLDPRGSWLTHGFVGHPCGLMVDPYKKDNNGSGMSAWVRHEHKGEPTSYGSTMRTRMLLTHGSTVRHPMG
jgi:hypothetical protein